VLLLYDTWGDIDVIVESITTLTVLFAASTKLINIVMNNHKVFFVLFFLYSWSVPTATATYEQTLGAF